MRVPIKWLNEFVRPEVDAAELARRLTLAGLEVEKIDIVGSGWDKVFTAYVNKVERHPDAETVCHDVAGCRETVQAHLGCDLVSQIADPLRPFDPLLLRPFVIRRDAQKVIRVSRLIEDDFQPFAVEVIVQ